MDISVIGNSFPQSAPFRHTVIVIHFLTMSFAFLICYPYAATQQSFPSSHKRYLLALTLTVLLTFIGFVIQYSPTTTSSDTILHFALKLSLLLLTSLDLTLEYISSRFPRLHQPKNIFHSLHRPQQLPKEQRSPTISLLFSRIYVPEVVKVYVKCVTLYLGYFYLVFSVFVFTSTSGSINQYWLPLAMGTGFVLYGSLAFMHLVNIISLQGNSNVEYYEAMVLTSWGFLSFMWWDTPVLGSSWKAINLGLLWTTGGILSLAVTSQSWVPILQKRNIINSIIICLTGKVGILSSYSNDDDYAYELHTTLGYILIIGSVARFIQIMFRKSVADNLPRLYSRASGGSDGSCDDIDGDEETCVDDLDIGKRRENDYELTYRQLTGMNVAPTPTISCKHQSIYASITMVCSILSCFMAISGGFLCIGTIADWVETMRYYISDPSTYVNVLLATSFLWTAYLLALCSLYKSSTTPTDLDYLDATTAGYSELPISSTKPPSPPCNYYDTYHMASTMTPSPSSTSSTSQTTQQQQTMLNSTPSASCTKPAPPLSNSCGTGSTTVSSPPMRPSQYRAKRRSLLISTSMQNNNQDNIRAIRTSSTSSSIGVGGILPDEVSICGDFYASSPINGISLEQHCPTMKDSINDHQKLQQQALSSPTLQRRSWRSSSSSLLASSPPRMPASTSISLASTSGPSRQQQSLDGDGDDGSHSNQSWTVYRTESGKRKERQWKKSKRPQAAPATTTKNGYTLQADEHQLEEDALSISSGSDGRGRPQCDSSEFGISDSRVF
ncbi:hypothetical protein BCR42DRAFT_102916 [Absidia repens]|uniref:Uncharacterized protein n=1 Tax=Absidia repens TaxID=90262 RepID=A0A1X2I7T6_9FUNG|nr:hypothetical protein BCR42DRAFT_102916 [Absidia repens]